MLRDSECDSLEKMTLATLEGVEELHLVALILLSLWSSEPDTGDWVSNVP